MVTESLQSLLEHEEAPAEFDQPSQAPQDDFVLAEDEQEQNEKPAAKDPAKDEPKVEALKEPEKVEERPKLRPDIVGIIDERKKRQAAEARLAELTNNQPKPDLYEDPDRYFNDKLSPLTQEIFSLKLQLAQTKYTGFDDYALAYLEAAEKDPMLKWQGDNAPDPLAFIYREGKRIKELAPFDGDIDKLVESKIGTAKTENESLKKQLAAMAQEVADLKKHKAELDEVPRSLNSAPSASRPRVEEEDDEDFGSMTVNKF